MAHNDNLVRGGSFSTVTVPTPGMLRRLDQAASESINGDAGGTWSPLSPITVGGDGVALSSAGGFTGGVATGPRAHAGALILGDSEWPTFSATRSKTVIFSLRDVSNAFLDYPVSPSIAPYDDVVPGSAIQGNAGGDFWVPLSTKRMPSGASIISVILHFRVGVRPTALPARDGPIFGLNSRIGSTGAAVRDIMTPAAPASIDLYFNDGLPKTNPLAPVNNSIVDSTRDYYLSLTPLATNICHSLEMVFDVGDLRPGI